MSTRNLNHRNLNITINLRPAVRVLVDALARLVEVAKADFAKDEIGKKIQKRWYSEQLANAAGLTYGYIYFTVTNRQIMKSDFDLDDPNTKVTQLEYSFHVKQIETP